jgi:hypothetical protein
MAAAQLHGEGNLWFFTPRSSPKIAEARLDQQVNLCYARAGKQDFLSVSRTAEPVHDKGKMQALGRRQKIHRSCFNSSNFPCNRLSKFLPKYTLHAAVRETATDDFEECIIELQP